MIVSAIQVAGVVLILIGAYLYNPAVGLAISGIVVLGLGWALDREE